MNRFLPLLGAIVFASSAAAATVPTPSIHLSGKTLTGAHFLAQKKVTVTIVGSSKSTFLTKPLKNGTFRLALGFNPLSGCGGDVKIKASGHAGESASLDLPKAQCPGGSSVGVTATGSDGSSVSASG
jgi:hypothetical protein